MNSVVRTKKRVRYYVEVWMLDPISEKIYSLGKHKCDSIDDAFQKKETWLYLYRERTKKIAIYEVSDNQEKEIYILENNNEKS